MIRVPAAAIALAGVLLLSAGAVAAHAEPTFSLSRAEAKAGENVQFSISGTEEGVEYTLEIRNRIVAEGSDPGGNGVARGFIMPNLGETSMIVTVEAEISQSDETTTLTHTLQYLTQSAAAVPPRTQAVPATSAPAVQPAPASRSTPRSRGRAEPRRRTGKGTSAAFARPHARAGRTAPVFQRRSAPAGPARLEPAAGGWARSGRRKRAGSSGKRSRRTSRDGALESKRERFSRAVEGGRHRTA